MSARGGCLETSSAQETEAIGDELAGTLRPGDVVLISGELGAGKTTLVRGAARSLGVSAPVTSPTFTIGQRYPTNSGHRVAHVDLYRVGSLAAEDPELLADYLGPDTITFVEWPEGSEAELLGLGGRIAAQVRLSHAGRDRRKVEVTR